MKKLIFMAALALAACAESEAEKAENEYRMAEASIIDPAQKKCAAAKKVAAAYAAEGDEGSYSQWDLRAYNDCFAADRY